MREYLCNGRGGRAIQWLYRRLGIGGDGVTIGHRIFYLGPWKTLEEVPQDLRSHEQFHVYQSWAFAMDLPTWLPGRWTVGILRFWAAYSWEFLKKGYRANKYERAARVFAGQEE